jgi:hypothetical protein
MQTKMAAMPDPMKTKMEMPLKAEGTGKAPEGPKPKEGTEELKLAGKTLKCKWTEMETEAGGVKNVTKTWMCEDVPGHLVKSHSKSAGQMPSETTMELVEFTAK